MTPTAAEILTSAKSLPREERAEVVKKLVATLGEHDVEQERSAALRTAVNKGLSGLDSGNGVRIPSGGLRGYLHERGRLASGRAADESQ
ncbi:hypothetical protein ACFQNE_08615 [Gordonia phosphorivorans]|uniref:Uncharacterized protein n=1 Tax=Gordonia phosphorivorans TaxID=1056982 RepID=A0ABV6H8B6_9ACTN